MSVWKILSKDSKTSFNRTYKVCSLTSIQVILDNNEESIKRSKQALLDVQKYTWDARAKNILDFIKR